MGTIYLIECLDGINGCLVFLFICSLVATIITFVWKLADDLEFKKFITALKIEIPILIFAILGLAFVPTTSAGYRILGIGSTLEYLQNSKDAKAVPDKTFKMINRVLDNVCREDTATNRKKQN